MKNQLLKIVLLIIVATAFIVSCSKEDENKINIDQYTGYYNLKDSYNGDLLLKITNNKETVSYYGSSNGSSIDVLASLYKDNSSGRRTAFKANATADTSIVYNFDRPELGGILFIKKGSITYVQEFKFQEDKKSIKPTFYLSKITKIINKRLAQKMGVTNIASGDIIDKGLGYFLDKLDEIVPKEVLDKIKKDSEDSSSSSKDNNKGLLDGLLNILKNIDDYRNKKELGNIIEKLMAEDPNPSQDQFYPPEKIPYVDCNNVPNGEAILDDCNRCIYGNTGLDYYCHCETSGLSLSVLYKAYSATLIPTGGSGSYQFEWLHNDSLEATAINLIPGKDYYGTVIDLKTSCRKSVIINVKGCEWPNSTLAITTSTTSNSATANPIGGQAPYKFLWSNGSVEKTATNLMSGTYTVTVTDDFGCSITSTVNIGCANSTLTVITSTTTNSATAVPTGGQTPYNFLWSNGSTQQTATNLAAGDYTVTVTDALKCTKVGYVNLVAVDSTAFYKEKVVGKWRVKNAESPNSYYVMELYAGGSGKYITDNIGSIYPNGGYSITWWITKKDNKYYLYDSGFWHKGFNEFRRIGNNKPNESLSYPLIFFKTYGDLGQGLIEALTFTKQ